MATEHVKIDARVPYEEVVADGIKQDYEFGFVIFSPADLQVYLDGQLTTNYALMPATAWPGRGTISFTTVPAAGVVIAKERAAPIERTTDFSDPGDFRASTLNDQLDYLTILLQDMDLKAGRALRTPVGEPPGLDLPSAATRQNSILGFDQTGVPVPVPQTALSAELWHREPFTTTAGTTVITLAHDPAGDDLVQVFIESAEQKVWVRSGREITLTGMPGGLSGRVEYYERLPFYQAVGESMVSAMRFGISPALAGDQTALFQASIDSGALPIALPGGDYTLTTASLTGQDRASGAAFLGFGATINGSDKQHGLRGLFFGADGLYGEQYDIWLNDGFSTGVDDQSPRPLIMLTAMTEDVSPIDHSKGKVPMAVTVHAYGSQHASGMRANLVNYSDDGNGNSAIYGRATTVPGCFWSAAVHGETRHAGGTSSAISAEAVSYTNDGSFYGVLVNNVSGGGGGMVPHQTEGTLAVKHDTATGLLIAGSAGTGKGEWRYGIRMRDGALRAADGEGIRLEDAALYQIHSTTSAVSGTADIQLEANSLYGVVLNGIYTSGTAMRLQAGQAIAWENTNVIKTYYDAASSQLQFQVSGSDRVSLELDPTPRILMNGTAVLKEPGAAISDPAADTASLQTAVIAILDRMRAATPTIQT